ncbi:MAG: thymidylate synthase [Candidatus Tenebribacter davisii]|nr:thymidylate synthase [Candidatus Tenebribacter davisii]
MTQNIIHVEATNLPDLWFQTLYKAIELGRDFTVDTGSFAGQKRKEMDYVILHAKCPGVGELLPKLNPALGLDDPVAQDYMDDYLPYLMTGEEAKGESYTYGSRICKAFMMDILTTKLAKINNILIDDLNALHDKKIIKGVNYGFEVNQMELMIWTYKNKGFRDNQMIMQVGQPSDMLLKDPPCLRHIDTRIQDGKLHFYPYFRSWDLWGGLPANLGAIELMKQYCAEQIGVENGEIIATSKGLHLYNYVWEIAETIRGRSAEEFKNEMIGKSSRQMLFEDAQDSGGAQDDMI